MSIRTELWGLIISGVLCWIGFGLTVFGSNPGAGTAALASFYISFFIGILSLLTVAGFAIRYYRSHRESKFHAMRTAFRQGILASGVLMGLMMMQAARLLSWWDALLLVIIVTLFELYIRSYGRTQYV